MRAVIGCVLLLVLVGLGQCSFLGRVTNVENVKNGAHITNMDSEVTSSGVKSYPFGPVAAAQTYSSEPLTSFTAVWTVPPEPLVKAAQTLYLYTGFQYASSSNISSIQTVLQWGKSYAGGGQYWSAASWYISTATGFTSPLLRVSPGDIILGNMTLVGTTWYVAIGVLGSTTTSSLKVDLNVEETEPILTYETWSITTCDNHPKGSVTFSPLTLSSAQGKLNNPAWQTNVVQTCDVSLTVASPTKIVIGL